MSDKDKKRKTSAHQSVLQRNLTNKSDYSSSIESNSSATLGEDDRDSTKSTKKKKTKLSKEDLYKSLEDQEKKLQTLNGLYTTIVNSNLILNKRMNDLEAEPKKVIEVEESSGFCGIYSLFNLIFDY